MALLNSLAAGTKHVLPSGRRFVSRGLNKIEASHSIRQWTAVNNGTSTLGRLFPQIRLAFARAHHSLSKGYMPTEAEKKAFKSKINYAPNHPAIESNDVYYLMLREEQGDQAEATKVGELPPRFFYPEESIRTWQTCYDKLMPLHEKNVLEVLLHRYQKLGITADTIPQQRDVSENLEKNTGFTLRPARDLWSSGKFIRHLGEKIFGATAYIRHHSKPLYTPEPDIVHELVGHGPTLQNKKTALVTESFGKAISRISQGPAAKEFAERINVVGLDAANNKTRFEAEIAFFDALESIINGDYLNPDTELLDLAKRLNEAIRQLGNWYWFLIEFGVSDEEGPRKAWGAGLLSSFGELAYAMSDPSDGSDGVQDPTLAHKPFPKIIHLEPNNLDTIKTIEDWNVDVTHYQEILVESSLDNAVCFSKSYIDNWGIKGKDPFYDVHMGIKS